MSDPQPPLPLSPSTAMLATVADSFKPSYRTAAGWICVVGLAHVFFLGDWINFAVQAYASYKMHALPVLQRPDTSITFELIALFCFLSGNKTYDRIKGVATS